MRRSRLVLVGLSAFGLVLVSFLIRGFGQFLVGPRTATLLAAPTFLLALALVLALLSVRLLAFAGLVRVDD